VKVSDVHVSHHWWPQDVHEGATWYGPSEQLPVCVRGDACMGMMG
jgi:hypothetical protein